MRVIFCGTGAFAVPSLQALIDGRNDGRNDPRIDVALVVTQPDRPAGRHRELLRSAVAKTADAAGIPVFQPEKLRDPEAVARLAAVKPDVIVVVSYGQILRPAVLTLPPLGCINVHGSLLPRHRGASPVHAAILAGDAETGVTIMRMDEGLDTGPMLATVAEAIAPDDTTPRLHDRLAALGARLLAPTLTEYAAGRITPHAQPNTGATLCRPIAKDAGRLDWTRPAVELERAVRAYTPWPGTAAVLRRADGTTTDLGVLQAALADDAPPGTASAAGAVVRVASDALVVMTGRGCLALLSVKPAGRGAMDVGAFLRGHRVVVGDTFLNRPIAPPHAKPTHNHD